MRNLAKTLIMMVTVVMSLAFSVSSVDAKEYKGYSAAYGHGVNVDRPGYAEFVNYGLQEISTNSGYTMYYNLKQASNVKSVKAPTMSSKKLRPGKAKQFIIKKNSVLKFKVIKGKVTKAKFKKAKTYYVVMKVKKNVPFASVKSGAIEMEKAGTLDTINFNYEAASDLYFTNNGTQPTKKNNIGMRKAFNITKDCTIKVAGYKYGYHLGTYTYKVTVKPPKTYTKPSKYKFYTVESNWICEGCQKIAYFDNGSGAYLTQSEIVVPDGFKLVTKYNGKNYYNYKLNTINTFYYELYRARYYKVNGKYEFASWELMEKNTLTYKVFKNTFNDGYSGFYGFVAPVDGFVKDNKGYEGVWAYYKKDGDSTVYRTFLKPGEPLDPDYQWIADEVKINGEREWAATQVKYHHDGLFNEFCTYKAFMEAYNGLHDEVNTYGKPVTPEVPQ